MAVPGNHTCNVCGKDHDRSTLDEAECELHPGVKRVRISLDDDTKIFVILFQCKVSDTEERLNDKFRNNTVFFSVSQFLEACGCTSPRRDENDRKIASRLARCKIGYHFTMKLEKGECKNTFLNHVYSGSINDSKTMIIPLRTSESDSLPAWKDLTIVHNQLKLEADRFTMDDSITAMNFSVTLSKETIRRYSSLTNGTSSPSLKRSAPTSVSSIDDRCPPRLMLEDFSTLENFSTLEDNSIWKVDCGPDRLNSLKNLTEYFNDAMDLEKGPSISLANLFAKWDSDLNDFRRSMATTFEQLLKEERGVDQSFPQISIFRECMKKWATDKLGGKPWAEHLDKYRTVFLRFTQAVYWKLRNREGEAIKFLSPIQQSRLKSCIALHIEMDRANSLYCHCMHWHASEETQCRSARDSDFEKRDLEKRTDGYSIDDAFTEFVPYLENVEFSPGNWIWCDFKTVLNPYYYFKGSNEPRQNYRNQEESSFCTETTAEGSNEPTQEIQIMETNVAASSGDS
mmetsp:Transcript_18921/g.53121  ORF Transcript_18921/g.53121 Transcript_18921/m.53121 type:complete len:513 (-) Transcript_18921:99-1637(-)